MDRERKTLTGFSRNYLRSLETPSITETALDEVSAEARFAVRVTVGMRRSVIDRARSDH